ncbi:hypothetical protein INS49_013524 [Diaporthe citri]|uniref:uncharacterized protein n=1 Tax=Diaporthe citri TaxID=83186 RepID=UPI001C7F3849|nr:uncharacterized protein INS49_013524 [Diaporthe citri]KAG6357647.1 hypothetical protein INS49_013524 [Diaporthe citri]
MFAELFKEHETYMMDLEARFPSLVEWIKGVEEVFGPVVEHYPAKVHGGLGGPLVIYNHGPHLSPDAIGIKGVNDMKDDLIKKATLLEEQTQILTRALEDNGIQIPQESAVIQARLDVLKRSSPPDEPVHVKESGRETGERQDPCPEARHVAFLEDHDGSAFTSGYVILQEPKKSPPPPPPPPPVEMDYDQLDELFDSMHRFRSSKCFKTPVTKEKSPKYFEMVREPRDLVIIKDRLNTVPGYFVEAFFNDIRLMLDNYSHVFGEGSDEHKSAERFQVAMFKKLEEYGEAGQTAKDQFNRAPRATFNELISSPEADDTIPSPMVDDTIPPSEEPDPIDGSDDADEAETSFAQGIRNNYEDDYGEERDDSYFGRNEDVLDFGDETGLLPKTPSTVGPAHKLGSRGDLADQSPSFQGPAEQSEGEDDLVNRAWGAFDMAKGYDHAHGHATRAPARHNTAQPRDDEDDRNSSAPGASGPAEQPGDQDEQGPDGPSPDTDKPAEQSEEFSIFNPYSSSPGAPGPAEQLDDNDSHVLSSIASPVPSPTAQPEAAAGESGDEAARASAHALEQPAPVAPMYAEQDVVDLTSSPQRRASHIDSASTKRARASEDQDCSSDDDAPLIKRRRTTAEPSSDDDAPLIKPRSTTAEPASIKGQETAAESSRYAVRPSLGKRSRGDDDGDDEEEREQPAKRNKVSSPSEPLAPVAAAPVGEPSLATIESLLRRVRNAQVPPSPIPEPITPAIAAADGPGSVSPPPMLDRRETPEPANDASATGGHEGRRSSPPNAAADEPEPEPATEDLGHTDNGTITVSKLHRLPKYKRKGRSKARGRPNRPWVFGYQFSDDYGLYIMSCPEKGCETGTEIFTTHPFMRNDAADHLQECGHDFTDDDDMVRKYCTQVISDEKKAVSIEWARKWNNDLMKEYGDEDRENENF